VNYLMDNHPKMSNWHFGHFAVALLFGTVLQILWLPRLCGIGKAKLTFDGVIDVLSIMRILEASFMGEEGTGWKVYCILSYSSFIWIDVVS